MVLPAQSPFSYMEEKLKTTKIITANNTRDKALLEKFPLNTQTRTDHPSRKNAGVDMQICTDYCTKVGAYTILPGS